MSAVYRWKIPVLSITKLKYLCYGYIREHGMKSCIPKRIAIACMDYFCDGNIVSKIKNLSQCQLISNILEIGPYKLQMRLLQNLFNEASITLNITLASGPITNAPTINAFRPSFVVRILETNTIAKPIHISLDLCGLSKEDQKCQFWYDFGPIKNLKSMLKNKITIELEISALSALNAESNIIHSKSVECDHLSTKLNEVMVPSGGYYWALCHGFDITHFKNASNGQYFCSPMFDIAAFNWMMKIFPNGDFAEDEGNVDLYLFVTSLPANIDTLYIEYRFIIHDNHKNKTFLCEGFHAFNHSELSLWISTLKTTQIQQLEGIVVKVEIAVLDIFDKNGRSIDLGGFHHIFYAQTNADKLSLDTFVWNINEEEMIENMQAALNGYCIESVVFGLNGFEWVLKVYPNGYDMDSVGFVDLDICLVSLPMDVKQISCYYELCLSEIDSFKDCGFIEFSKSEMKTGWTTNKFPFVKLKEINMLTFKVTMRVINVYDVNDDFICKYVQHDGAKIYSDFNFDSNCTVAMIDHLIDIFT